MTLRKLKSKDNVEACGERGPFGSAILSPYGRVRVHVHMCVLVCGPLWSCHLISVWVSAGGGAYVCARVWRAEVSLEYLSPGSHHVG